MKNFNKLTAITIGALLISSPSFAVAGDITIGVVGGHLIGTKENKNCTVTICGIDSNTGKTLCTTTSTPKSRKGKRC